MTHYSTPDDRKYTKEMLKNAPTQGQAWLNFDHEVFHQESAIPAKYKELIAIAVSLTTQCPYCIERHIQSAKKLGVTQQELSETVMLTAALRSGAALGYGLLASKLYQQSPTD